MEVMLPSDCWESGESKQVVDGGVIMKLMDSTAGVVSARWCRTNVVTVGIDAIDMHKSVQNGDLVTVLGRLTYTSSKSLEVHVIVLVERRNRYFFVLWKKNLQFFVRLLCFISN